MSPRWVTNAWAYSSGAPDVVDALGAGRCWFVDPAAYRGDLNISALDQPAMGGALVTRDRKVPIKVQASDLPTDSTLEVITGLVDFAGTSVLEPANSIKRIPASAVRRGAVRFDLQPQRGKYVRTVVRNANGKTIGFSNPTWVLPKTPPGGIPANRVL